MKRYCIVGSICALGLCVTSFITGTPELPDPVKTAFQKHYSEARKVKWEKENDVYEAEFELNKLNMSAVFDVSGTIPETEIEIPVSELLTNCKSNLPSEFTGARIKEAAKIVKTNGTVLYEAEVKGVDVFFDVEGNLLKPTE